MAVLFFIFFSKIKLFFSVLKNSQFLETFKKVNYFSNDKEIYKVVILMAARKKTAKKAAGRKTAARKTARKRTAK